MASKYFVDLYNPGGRKKKEADWVGFKSLKKAVRAAREEGIDAQSIVDRDGNTIPDLDIDDPQWLTHRELEARLTAAEDHADRAEKRLAKAEDARRTRQITLIQAGYVPIELITERLTNVQVERNGIRDHATVTLTMAGDPGPIDAEHKRRPFTALLEALRNGLQK
jgi:hypothetical protein